MEKPQFVEDQIYHIYNRGVEKRKVFLNKKDYFRFIHDMFEFNDGNPVINNFNYLNCIKNKKTIEVQPRCNKPRELLVEILAFVLMPNHFHFLLKQKQENGITKFMQKMGTGYTMYFNKKNERVGSLFQGRFKAVLIEKESHFIYLPSYIHLNSLDLIDYRGSTSIELEEKLEFLENYRWSSYPDYVGHKNFPSITSRDQYLGFFGGQDGYKNEIKRLLKEDKKRISEEIKELTLE
ncbi:MAG: transposase [Parcubacteria group bacterium]|jgi:putative transposase